jgi:hypothetical protein
MMPTTGDQDGDDQSGGGNYSSTASPVQVTQDEQVGLAIFCAELTSWPDAPTVS